MSQSRGEYDAADPYAYLREEDTPTSYLPEGAEAETAADSPAGGRSQTAAAIAGMIARSGASEDAAAATSPGLSATGPVTLPGVTAAVPGTEVAPGAETAVLGAVAAGLPVTDAVAAPRVTRRQLRAERELRQAAAAARHKRRNRILAIAAFVAIAAALAIMIVSGIRGDEGESATDPTATPTATATSAGDTPLLSMLPTSVTENQYSEEGPGQEVFTLTADGYVPDPNAADGASEAVVGQFVGGAEPVTLTAALFPDADAASAQAEALAAELGTALDTGTVFPAEDLGTYWIFNTDGLVTIVWHDGQGGAFTVLSQDAEAALGFYHGLDF